MFNPKMFINWNEQQAHFAHFTSETGQYLSKILIEDVVRTNPYHGLLTAFEYTLGIATELITMDYKQDYLEVFMEKFLHKAQTMDDETPNAPPGYHYGSCTQQAATCTRCVMEERWMGGVEALKEIKTWYDGDDVADVLLALVVLTLDADIYHFLHSANKSSAQHHQEMATLFRSDIKGIIQRRRSAKLLGTGYEYPWEKPDFWRALSTEDQQYYRQRGQYLLQWWSAQ